MKIDSTWDSARRRLFDLINDRGVKLAALSRALGKNAAYIQQYLYRRSPVSLHEDDRVKLANYFNVNPDEFRLRHEMPPDRQPNLDTRLLNAAIISALSALVETRRPLDDFSHDDIARVIIRTYLALSAARLLD